MDDSPVLNTITNIFKLLIMLTFPFNTDVRFTLIPMVGGVKIEQSDMEELSVRIENKNRGVLFEPEWDITDKGIEIEIQREKIPFATSYTVIAEWRRPDGSFSDGYQDIQHSCNAIEFKKDCNIQCGNGVLMIEASQCYKGTPGKGVPAGGAPGQALVKKTNEDYDTEWKTLSSGGGTGDGNDGKTPVIGSITAESVAYGTEPSFSLTHTSNDGDGNPVYTGTIKIPKGKDGDDGIDGKTPVFEIGTVETLAAGSQATASIVPDGETTEGNPKYKVSFGIPKGANGTGEGGGTTNPEWTDIEGKPSWIGVTKPTYTASEIGALPTSHNSDTEAHGGIAAKISTLETKVQTLESGGSGTIVYEDVEPGEFFGTSDAIPTPVASISITPSTFKLNIGAKQTLVATVLPLNASNKKVNWTTSNPLVATVSNGVVTAIAEGNVTISALAADGSGVGADASGTVEQAEQGAKLITNISLNKVYLQLEAGNTEQLTANITPSDADNKVLVWSSSNPAVATVEDGLVTAVADGSTTITATSTDGSGKSGNCNLVVQAAAPSSSLIADWDFTLYPDGYQGVVDDLSGNGNYPELTGLGKYTTGRDGILNGTFMHNGGGSVISMKTPEIMEKPDTLTFEMYVHLRMSYNDYAASGVKNLVVRESVEPYQAPVFFILTSGTSTGNYLQITPEKLNVAFPAGVNNGGAIDPPIYIDGIGSDIITNDFHHLVFVLTTGRAAAYLDGRLIVETTAAARNYQNTGVKFLQGSFLRGDVKRIRMYNEALTTEQVSEKYNELLQQYES